jgi:hypothetical protein
MDPNQLNRKASLQSGLARKEKLYTSFVREATGNGSGSSRSSSYPRDLSALREKDIPMEYLL